ncbi:MAG: zinc metalloprotease HtpX [Longimicrobiales bacterium]|nr:zinc metalloprotease HtpX [Longimicrobiales bacterium]
MQIFKVITLMTGLTVLLVAAGGYFGGSTGAVIFFGIALAMNLGSYWFSDRVVLRMYRARVIEPGDAPELHEMVERLARRADLPTPTVAIAPHRQPNAFATGRDPEHGVVCFTQGILEALSYEELEGVTAHELAHIKHRHMLVGAIAATMAGAVTMLATVARWGAIFAGGRNGDRNPIAILAMSIVAPLAAVIVQMAISRQNEFQADRTAAEITGTPAGLASALRRLDVAARGIPMEVNPAAAQLAIVSPFSGRRGLSTLFSTHPPMEERIARLLDA